MTLQLPLRPRGAGLWFVRVPDLHTCDIPLCLRRARYDAKVPGDGRWAYICEQHALIYNIRLGMGMGQLLLLSDEELPA